MTAAIAEQTIEAVSPAGDPEAELRELFELDAPDIVTLVSIECVTHITNCSNHIICCE